MYPTSKIFIFNHHFPRRQCSERFSVHRRLAPISIKKHYVFFDITCGCSRSQPIDNLGARKCWRGWKSEFIHKFIEKPGAYRGGEWKQVMAYKYRAKSYGGGCTDEAHAHCWRTWRRRRRRVTFGAKYQPTWRRWPGGSALHSRAFASGEFLGKKWPQLAIIHSHFYTLGTLSAA